MSARYSVTSSPACPWSGFAATPIESPDVSYQERLIGGPGAFMIPVQDRQQSAEAIRTKLVREISGELDREPLVRPAQDRERFNCLVGEMQRRRQWEP